MKPYAAILPLLIAAAGSLTAQERSGVSRVSPRALTAQAVNFPAPADTLYSAGPVSLSATATSGLSVSFASTTSSVCTVTGTSVTLLRLGTCTITASQPGNGTYAAATPVSQSFNVNGMIGTALRNGNLAAVASDARGAVFVLDFYNGILKLTSTGTFSLVTRIGTSSYRYLAADLSGNFYVSGGGSYQVSRISASGVSTIIAGNGLAGFSGDGGPATSARLNNPAAIAVDASGNVYIADTENSRIRRVASDGTISTVAGNGVPGNSGDGSAATAASLAYPQGVAVDTSGNLYIADYGNGSIRMVSATGIISTLASGINTPGVTIDADGNIWVSGGTIRKIGPSGQVSIAAGGGSSEVDGIPATSAGWNGSNTLAVDATGNLYIAVPYTGSLREVKPLAETIVFPPPPDRNFTNASITIIATSASGRAVTLSSDSDTVCSVAGNVLTLLATGICTLTATLPGNATYTTAQSVHQSFAISPGPQSITATAPTGTTVRREPVAVVATASSGLPVSMVSTTPSVCNVTTSAIPLIGLGSCPINTLACPLFPATFLITPVSAGTCTLTATQSGNANFTSAPPVTQSFTISPGSQTIVFPTLASATINSGPVPLAATSTSGLTVSFASNTPSTCTVSGTNAVLVATGTCSISATQPGNANYNAATAVTQAFTVSQSSQTITLLPPTQGISGRTASLAATSTSGLPVTYTSTTPAICSVAGSIVSFTSAGTCSITAAQPGDSNYLPATTVSVNIPVINLSITITALPAWGVDGAILGTVTGQQSVAVALLKYAFIADYGWVQPGGCGQVSISTSGQFVQNTTAGSLERYATRLTFFLVPSSIAASVPCQQGAPDIPDVVRQNALTSTSYPRLPGYQTLNFGGLDWLVKTAPLPVWPNANNFSASNAFVDSSGALHLQVGACGQGFCSAEILTKQTLGYGTYTFNISSPVNALDPNITFGAFTWDAQAYAQSNREWDIELSRWGVPTDPNAQFVVQPYTGATNMQRFNITSAGSSQHSVTWSPTSVAFVSTAGGASNTWSYTPGTYPVPTPGDTHLHLNLYLGRGTTPYYTSSDREIVITQFSYTPASQSIGLPRSADSIVESGGTQSVTLTGSTGCSATVESDSPWISVLGSVGNSSVVNTNGSFQYSVVANTSSSRVGHIILTSTNCNTAMGGQVLTVTQAATSANLIFFSADTSISMGSKSTNVVAFATSGLPVTVTSNTPAICTVSGTIVSPVAVGTCSLTATQPGDSFYVAATPASVNISIVPGSQIIIFPAPSPFSLGTGPVGLQAVASSGLNITFNSLTPAVCTVSGSLATLLAIGTCTVTASQIGNSNYFPAAPVTQSFTVTAPLSLVTLSLGDTFGTTGTTVEVPVQIATNGTAAPATLQLDLGFDLAKLSYVANSARIGPRGTAAGKTLGSSVQSNGALRLLVSGLNQNPIAPGVVAYASFTLSAQFLSGTSVITPANCSSVDGTAAAITTTCTPGTVRYSSCDVNLDGNANVADVQLIINEALGVIPAVHDLNADGAVNVADVQIVINAALGLGCTVH